ncbi:HK97-gp10 family putative phage morphogenesis protein [Metasolibacillus meyeri]|uniref:HK97-gp10 family putative phage morphogenesis protein n=1 Tax=Metasolibacillus meyeri TaxID=1071052 RepID=UPI000D2FD2B8|nr:HK97-gp10 family putative phage morphogenesis protein [Metasolibacillus meyeri]
MGITRIGNKRLRKAARRWQHDVITDVKRVVVETANRIKAEAIARAPRDTGDLIKSIEVEILNDGLLAIVRVGVHYAIYVEYGTGIYAEGGKGRKTPWTYYSDELNRWVTTKGMAPQPFWRPAIQIASEYFVSEMRKIGR